MAAFCNPPRRRTGSDRAWCAIDVLWFRISRRPDDPAQVLGNVNYGKALILIDRSDYFQAGLIIPKGSYSQIQSLGIDAFRDAIAQIVPCWASESTNCATGNRSNPHRSDQSAATLAQAWVALYRRRGPRMSPRAAWALTCHSGQHRCGEPVGRTAAEEKSP